MPCCCPAPFPSLPLQPSATEEDPSALYWSRSQYMHVLSPARTVVVYKKVEENGNGGGAPPPPPQRAQAPPPSRNRGGGRRP